MKPLRDYLDLNEEERWFLDSWDLLPAEVLPLLEKMLTGNRAEFDEAERKLRAYAANRRKETEQKE